MQLLRHYRVRDDKYHGSKIYACMYVALRITMEFYSNIYCGQLKAVVYAFDNLYMDLGYALSIIIDNDLYIIN